MFLSDQTLSEKETKRERTNEFHLLLSYATLCVNFQQSFLSRPFSWTPGTFVFIVIGRIVFLKENQSRHFDHNHTLIFPPSLLLFVFPEMILNTAVTEAYVTQHPKYIATACWLWNRKIARRKEKKKIRLKLHPKQYLTTQKKKQFRSFKGKKNGGESASKRPKERKKNLTLSCILYESIGQGQVFTCRVTLLCKVLSNFLHSVFQKRILP